MPAGLAELTTNLLCISDFVSQFKEWLRLSPLDFSALRRAVCATAVDPTSLPASAVPGKSQAGSSQLTPAVSNGTDPQHEHPDQDAAQIPDESSVSAAEQQRASQQLEQLFEELLRAVLQACNCAPYYSPPTH